MGRVTAEIEGFVGALARVPGNRRLARNAVELGEPPLAQAEEALRRMAKRGCIPILSEQKRIAAKRIERERVR